MKKILVTILCCSLSLSAFAQDASLSANADASEANKNITAGHWNVSGYMDFSSASGFRTDGQDFETSIGAKYFVIENFGVGLSASYSKLRGSDSVSYAGPIAAYHFWNTDKLSAFTELGFRIGLSDYAWDSRMSAAIGLDYFLTPSVAVGPSVFFNRYNSGSNSASTTGMSINFGIYL